MSAIPAPIAPGAPCTCAPDRYVRYAIARAPGVAALVSCRENGKTGPQSIREHAPAKGTFLAAAVPDLETERPPPRRCWCLTCGEPSRFRWCPACHPGRPATLVMP